MESCHAESLVLEGRFELQFLTEGGMSTVYEGVDRSTGNEVVAKMAPASDLELASALIREHETLIRLQHPGIVRVVALVRDEGRVFLVMEKVPGQDLAQVARQGDVQVDEARGLDWAVQLGEILCYLHSQSPPVVYRDMKPSNVMLGPEGRLVLVDFGAARVRAPGVLETVPLGTPGYAPPEQYAGTDGSADERADLYSLGVTVYQMLVRREPVDFGFRLPPPAELGVLLSPAFEKVLTRAIDPEPSRRYQSAAALLRDLRIVRREPSRMATWCARVAVAVMACGLAGLLAQVPVDVLEGFFRRACLELGAQDVPLQPGIAVRGVVAAWMAVVVSLVFCAFRSGRGRLALLAFLLVTVVPCGVLVGRMDRRDAAAGVPVASSAVAWNVTVESQAGQPWGIGLVSHEANGETWLMVRQSPTRFSVVGGRSGRVAWSSESIENHLLFRDDRVVQVQGNTISLRSPRDGSVQEQVRASEAISRMMWDFRSPIVLQLESGRTEVARLALLAPADAPATAKVLVTVNARGGELLGISAASGQVAWRRPLSLESPFQVMDAGDRTLLVTPAGVEGLDRSSGKTSFRFALPVAAVDAASFHRLRFCQADGEEMVLQVGNRLHRIRLPEGKVLATHILPDAQTRVQPLSRGRFLVSTGDGRLLEMHGEQGLVDWEMWSGRPWWHLWPKRCAGFEFVERAGAVVVVQQGGSSLLRALDPMNGRVVWQCVLPDGLKVSGIVDDGTRYFVTGSDRDGKVRVVALDHPAMRVEAGGGAR